MVYILAAIEMICGLLAAFGLYKGLLMLKQIGAGTDNAQVVRTWSHQVMYVVLSFLALVTSVLVGERSLLALLLSGGVALFFIAAGGGVTWLRLQALKGGPLPAADTDVTSDMVEIRALRPGHMRGVGDDDQPMFFTLEEMVALTGVRGRVQMISWATSKGVSKGSMQPLWMFWSDQGDKFLLYPDDAVVAVS